jgi:isoleucyl-tRNA synthetase
MTDHTDTAALNYAATLFLPKTSFPMRAVGAAAETATLQRWKELKIEQRAFQSAARKPRFILHDGPPYANGHLHIGHALNKVLKDVTVRSKRMSGWNAPYVPGWDCHGLPIEWKVEQEFMEAGRAKGEIPVAEFRAACRAYAEHWVAVQAGEFKALGLSGDFDRPYTTMTPASESAIAAEFLKLAVSGQLRRGTKPVMWSVVERTALAEAEVEHLEREVMSVWAKFPVAEGAEDLLSAFAVAWTTTPWTLPANRALAYSLDAAYGLYEVTEAPDDTWVQTGERFLLADKCAPAAFAVARATTFAKVRDVTTDELSALVFRHPLGDAYDFKVPALPGPHVTDEAGTGFVHVAPGHGPEDFHLWNSHAENLESRGISTEIPFTLTEDGLLTDACPGFSGLAVLTERGDEGKAVHAVLDVLAAANMSFARRRYKHRYPHSWRSHKPVVFRNTAQWFIPMDRDLTDPGDTLRCRAMKAIEETKFTPEVGKNRLVGMVRTRPEWLVSRQRVWGVPLPLFVNEATGEVIPRPGFEFNDAYVSRVTEIFSKESADAWFVDGSKHRFLKGFVADVSQLTQVNDVLDVWFDSGASHAFVLDDRLGRTDEDEVMYLEGSDQHRGWFQSSLLESCATRGRAPFDHVLTHGFVMAEREKMSKSKGNFLTPHDVATKYGTDVMRLWILSSDYTDDIRVGPNLMQATSETYRKVRNTLRWLLGNLRHFDERAVSYSELPALERRMLHRLAEIGGEVEAGYTAFDYRKVVSVLTNFMTNDLSAFYFDVRKDVLYCDPASSKTRAAALFVLSKLFDCLVHWMAPLMPFTMDEAWLARHPDESNGSVHLGSFPTLPEEWKDVNTERWDLVMTVRSLVTVAIEREREEGRVKSSLEATPTITLSRDAIEAFDGIDMQEICITSGCRFVVVDDEEGVPKVEILPAEGTRCERSRKYVADVGADPEYPSVSARDAAALKEFYALAA